MKADLATALQNINDYSCDKLLNILEKSEKYYFKYRGDDRANLMFQLQYLRQKLGDSSEPQEKSLLNLVPYKKSKWDRLEWTKFDEFKTYTFTEAGVKFRDKEFLPGDIFIVTPNTLTGGLFTAFATPSSSLGHLALFLILEIDNEKFPAVIETYEHGVRAVPLKEFLIASYINYIEVFRCHKITKDQYPKINSSYTYLKKKCYGYSFYIDDRDENYFTCTRVASELFQYLEIDCVQRYSFFDHASMNDNFVKMGHNLKSFLQPEDFARNNHFEMIAIVDNLKFEENISRYMALSEYAKSFKKKDMDLRKISYLFSCLSNIAMLIFKHKLLADLILPLFGYNERNLPRGPAFLLSYYFYVDLFLPKIVKESSLEIRKNCLDQYISIDELKKNKEYQRIADLIKQRCSKLV